MDLEAEKSLSHISNKDDDSIIYTSEISNSLLDFEEELYIVEDLDSFNDKSTDIESKQSSKDVVASLDKEQDDQKSLNLEQKIRNWLKQINEQRDNGIEAAGNDLPKDVKSISQSEDLSEQKIKKIRAIQEIVEVLKNEDMITGEERSVRILWILIITVCISLIVSSIQIAFLATKSQNHVLIMQPNIINPFLRKYPILHIAVIDVNGSVADFSTMESISQSKGLLIKLPYSQKYLGYSDDVGALFFIDGELKKPIVKFHKALNKRGYINHHFCTETVKHKGDHIDLQHGEVFTNGLSIGSHYALLFLEQQANNFNFAEFFSLTKIWHKKKQIITAGTDLPDPFKDLHRSHPYTIPCVVSLNSTHFMALGYNTIHWLKSANGMHLPSVIITFTFFLISYISIKE